MTRLWIIADDYGLGEGHDAAIRDLLNQGAINAVSVLVESCSADSASLLSNVSAGEVRIGLHFNLTYAVPGTTPRPSRLRLLVEGMIGLRRAYARNRLNEQYEMFKGLFGRPPDFVDGHEHCHSFPTLRRAVIELAASQRVPVRSMVPLSPPKGLKEVAIARLGGGLQRALLRRGAVTNWRFGGVLPLTQPEQAVHRLASDLHAAREAARTAPGEIWFMVHPGDERDMRQIDGHSPRLRRLEAEFLAKSADRQRRSECPSH